MTPDPPIYLAKSPCHSPSLLAWSPKQHASLQLYSSIDNIDPNTLKVEKKI